MLAKLSSGCCATAAADDDDDDDDDAGFWLLNWIIRGKEWQKNNEILLFIKPYFSLWQ